MVEFLFDHEVCIILCSSVILMIVLLSTEVFYLLVQHQNWLFLNYPPPPPSFIPTSHVRLLVFMMESFEMNPQLWFSTGVTHLVLSK